MQPQDSIRIFMIQKPEQVFSLPSLTYNSTEIDDIIDRFDNAANAQPVHGWVKDLLRATKDFRRSTKPDGLFAQARALNATEDELKLIFIKIADEITHAENLLIQFRDDPTASRILSATLTYCKKSIKERINSLNHDDKLLKVWDESELRKLVE